MADDEAKVLAAARKLPLRERLDHKAWKARSEACEEIRTSAESAAEGAASLDELAALLPAAVADANANVVDKALEAAAAVLARCRDPAAASAAESLCKSIGAKCLAARAGTVKKTEEVLLLLVEAEQGAVVVDALITGFGHKVMIPFSIHAPAISCTALHRHRPAHRKRLGDQIGKHTERARRGRGEARDDQVWGSRLAESSLCPRRLRQRSTSRWPCTLSLARAVKPQPVLKALPGLFDSKDAKVRDAAKALTVVLSRWVGRELVESALLEKMREAMRKDVAELLDGLPAEKPKAARLTRKEAAKKAAKAAAAAPEGDVAAAPAAGGAAPRGGRQRRGGRGGRRRGGQLRV
eukprot:jgi/Tetstr1/458710/TSEL_045099.t1